MRWSGRVVGLTVGLGLACGGDEEAEQPAGTGVDPLLHECVEREPRSESGVLTGTVTEDERVTTLAWTAPDDALTGVAEFQVTSPVGDPHIVPALWLEYDGDGISDVDLDDGPVTAAVAAQPGVTVEVSYEDYSWHPEIGYPYGFEIAWTWTRRDDCYEPNDVRADAKHVPTGVDLEAWMFAAVGPEVPGEEVDWYRFTLTERADVTVTTVDAGTTPIMLELFAPGAEEAEWYSFVDESIAADGLRPGTYLVRAQPFAGMSRFDEPDAKGSLHLWEPYTLRIDVGE